MEDADGKLKISITAVSPFRLLTENKSVVTGNENF